MPDPVFLTREQVMFLHGRSLELYGGAEGVRDHGLIESSIAAGWNAWHYARADSFPIAATYAFHLSEAQAFLDGNKRTAVAAALAFLALNGHAHMPKVEELEQLYNAMIGIASKQVTKAGLAELFRELFLVD